MVTKLPRWKGYTIDERLGEFRKVTTIDGKRDIEFIPFASRKGMRIQYRIDKERLYGKKKLGKAI